MVKDGKEKFGEMKIVLAKKIFANTWLSQKGIRFRATGIPKNSEFLNQPF